jgi:hypothetical protein
LDTFLTNFGELRIGEARGTPLFVMREEASAAVVVTTDTASADADHDNGATV